MSNKFRLFVKNVSMLGTPIREVALFGYKQSFYLKNIKIIFNYNLKRLSFVLDVAFLYNLTQCS